MCETEPIRMFCGLPVIAAVLPCVETPGDPGIVEEAFATMARERDRIDADIARLREARNALDARASSRSACLPSPIVHRSPEGSG